MIDELWIVQFRHKAYDAWDYELFTQEENARGFAADRIEEHSDTAFVGLYKFQK